MSDRTHLFVYLFWPINVQYINCIWQLLIKSLIGAGQGKDYDPMSARLVGEKNIEDVARAYI
jgi:hypothetical protein